MSDEIKNSNLFYLNPKEENNNENLEKGNVITTPTMQEINKEDNLDIKKDEDLNINNETESENNIVDEDLLNKFESNRDSLISNVTELEALAKKVNDLLPNDYNYKNRIILSDRVKNISELYRTILQYRSEISSVLQDEMKIKSNNNGQSNNDMLNDISKLDLTSLFGKI